MLTCEYINRVNSPTSKPHSNFLLATFKLLSSYTGGGPKCWPALGPRLGTTGIKKITACALWRQSSGPRNKIRAARNKSLLEVGPTYTDLYNNNIHHWIHKLVASSSLTYLLTTYFVHIYSLPCEPSPGSQNATNV